VKKVTTIMILIGIILTSFAGCRTTWYGVEISNVHSISELNIRNAGTAHWGPNLAGTRDNIDTSGFSDRVDIRVVDANGFVHSRFNVPFDAGAFVETRENYQGMGTNALLAGTVLGALAVFLVIAAIEGDTDTAMAGVGGFR